MRSTVAAVQIADSPPLSPTIDKYINNEKKLLAVVDVKAGPTSKGSEAKAPEHIYLTLTNLSKSAPIGIIDPFLWRIYEDYPPVHWRLRKRGEENVEFLQRKYVGSRWGARRADFVILPPQGIVSSRVMLRARRLDRGEFDVSVDLTGGIVTDAAELEVLRSGDLQVGYSIGGTDWSVLDGSSITQRHFVVD